jgi:hypothetical protein
VFKDLLMVPSPKNLCWMYSLVKNLIMGKKN